MIERIVDSDVALGELEASSTFEEFYQAEARSLFRRLWLVTGLGFSPQGDRILYVGWGTSETPFTLYSIGVDGSDPHLLVKWAMLAQWRPR